MVQDLQMQAQILLPIDTLDQQILVHHTLLDKVTHRIIPKQIDHEPLITTMMTASPAAATVGTTVMEDFMTLISLIQTETAEEME